MKYKVLAEFVDRETGDRYIPAAQGEKPTLFRPHDDEQRERLVAAGVLAGEPTFDLATKPIEDLTRAEMEEIAVAAFRAEMASASDDNLRHGVASHRERIAEADLGRKTVDQLKEIAADEDIDLGEATRKADIVAAIEDERAKRRAE